MVSGRETIKRLLETENGCDHRCGVCVLFLKDSQRCIYEDHRKWKEWAEKRHQQFGEYLKGVK